jgi:hypothetical protein
MFFAKKEQSAPELVNTTITQKKVFILVQDAEPNYFLTNKNLIVIVVGQVLMAN